MEKTCFFTTVFTLGYVLEELDKNRQFGDVELLLMVSDASKNIRLTYAETILLLEGTQTGIADCTLPPYVQYEDVFGTAKNTIRSEFLQWCLESGISKTLLKNGFLKIEGATITSALNYNSEEISLLQNGERIISDHHYALDLSSRTISVDIEFKNCTFIKGIKFNDSYAENIIFEHCIIGETEGWSINAKNTTLNGEFRLNKKPSRIKSLLDKEGANILGKLDFASFTSNNAMYLEEIHVRGEIIMEGAEVMHTISLNNSVLYSAFNGYNLRCDMLMMNSVTAHKLITLSFAKIQRLFCAAGSNFFGSPTSLEAPGLNTESVFLREGTFVASGAIFHKSKIDFDFDCSGSYFGYSTEKDYFGVSLLLRNSSVQNATLNNGFISFGIVDISSSFFDYLHLKQGIFINPQECGLIEEKPNSKNYAILGNNSEIGSKLTFNFSKGIKITSDTDNVSRVRNIHHRLIRQYEMNNKDYLFNWLNFDGLILDKKTAKFEEEYDAICKELSNAADEIEFSVNTAGKNKNEIIKRYNDDYSELEKVFNKITDLKEKIKQNELVPSIANAKELEHLNRKLLNEIRHKNKLDSDCIQKYEEVKQLNNVIKELTESLKDPNYEACVKIIDLLAKYNLKLPAKEFHNLFCAIHIFKAFKKIVLFYEGLKKPGGSDINSFALVYGGATFSELQVNGEIDCAGAIFYKDAISEHIALRSNVWKETKKDLVRRIRAKPREIEDHPTALSLVHANIGGTLYLNTGDEENRTPFIARGEVDIQYTTIKHFSITPLIAVCQPSRWNLIGTNYANISDSGNYWQAKETHNEHDSWDKRSKNQLSGYFSDDLVTLESCKWIFPYYGHSNFRQPFEMLSNTVFNNGDDVQARKIIVNRTPSRNIWEEVIFIILRIFFWITFPTHRALVALLTVFIIGCYVFNYAWDNTLLIDKQTPKIPFHNVSYAFEKLLPFAGSKQTENIQPNFSLSENNSLFSIFLVFYYAYTIFATFFISMVLLSLAKMRRNSS